MATKRDKPVKETPDSLGVITSITVTPGSEEAVQAEIQAGIKAYIDAAERRREADVKRDEYRDKLAETLREFMAEGRAGGVALRKLAAVEAELARSMSTNFPNQPEVMQAMYAAGFATAREAMRAVLGVGA